MPPTRTILTILFLCLVPLSIVAETPAVPTGAEKALQLQLIIDFNGQRNPQQARDAAEALSTYITTAFRTRGFKRNINHIAREKSMAHETTLVVNVVRWQYDRLGNSECTLVAGLFHEGVLHELGEFSASDLPGSSREALRQVAERASRKLTEAIRDQNLLPEFAPKKKKG